MTLALAGFGTALPEHRFAQSELAELQAGFCALDGERERTLKALYRRSGVDTRGSVLLLAGEGSLEERQSFYPPAQNESDPGPPTAERMLVYAEAAPAIARAAAERSLAAADAAPATVTHLVTVSCTGFMAPGLDAKLVEDLGLPRTTQRTHVGFMGCHGALNGIRVARALAQGGDEAVALVCSVELCTLHFSYGWDPDMMVANALFGDGAASVVCRAAAEGSDEWQIGGTGTFLLPDSSQDMTWRIGDHGFRMTLSARVPELIESHLSAWLVPWLGAHGLQVEDVGSWAVHPGGPRILTAVERALGIDRDHSRVPREVLSECGNMSSATILFILERLRRVDAPRPCVAMAFGPGLVVEALLIV